MAPAVLAFMMARGSPAVSARAHTVRRRPSGLRLTDTCSQIRLRKINLLFGKSIPDVYFMKKSLIHSFFASAVLMASLCSPLHSQVIYDGTWPWSQRASDGPDAEVPGWYYNLGLTGIRAELVTDQPKALLVRYVFPNTPAHALIQPEDLIIGVNGTEFTEAHRNGYGMALFGAHGPVLELANALEACQAPSGSGKLSLMVTRGAKTRRVVLTIGKEYGSYSPSFPARCPKSDKIRNELLTYIASQQEENGSFGDPVHNTFSVLAMLGSGDKQYLPAVEKNLRHLCDVIESTADDNRYSLMNWTYMGAAIGLSEYYLLTKKRWVLPKLTMIRDLIYEGQYLDMSQIDPKVMESHPHLYPTGPRKSHGGWGHNPGFEGYGPIAMLSAQGALVYSLMQRCGIEIDRNRHEAAYSFLKRGTGQNGYLWYADTVDGEPDTWADMGRTGAAGIAFALSPYPDRMYRNRKQALRYSDVIGRHPQSFPDTHGSPIMGMAYEALGAHIKPQNYRNLMDANRWWFTMAQCADGTFYYQPNRDNAGYDSMSRMTASSVAAFLFTIPKRNLTITRKVYR
jgi:hypothetical protein